MLYPTINQLTAGQFNRYELVIATAKCARMVTDEYVRQREAAEKAVAGTKDGDKAMSGMIDREYRDEKAVKVAINHIYAGDFSILPASDEEEEDENDALPVSEAEVAETAQTEDAPVADAPSEDAAE